jgi:hypothetical protein
MGENEAGGGRSCVGISVDVQGGVIAKVADRCTGKRRGGGLMRR